MTPGGVRRQVLSLGVPEGREWAPPGRPAGHGWSHAADLQTWEDGPGVC